MLGKNSYIMTIEGEGLEDVEKDRWALGGRIAPSLGLGQGLDALGTLLDLEGRLALHQVLEVDIETEEEG